MAISRVKPAAPGVILAAFCCGLLVSRLAAPARASADISPIETLLAEDQMRQKIALYGLYADGSGPGGEPRDLKAMADTLMTPDVVSEIHRAAGGPPAIYAGRDFISKTPAENDPERARRISGRHYLVATVFDDVSASVAHTRTTAVYFDATKFALGPPCDTPGQSSCGGAPVRTIMWVYHMTWKKRRMAGRFPETFSGTTIEMRIRMPMSAWALAAILAAPILAFAQAVPAMCSDDSRACLIGTASRYIDGLSHHDASAIAFSPAVRCTEQGEIPVTDAPKFRAEIDSSTAITGIRNLRLMADTQAQSVVAFYMLDIAAYGGKPAYTVRRGQRFKIVNGLISEVEIINYVDPKLDGLAKPLLPDSEAAPGGRRRMPARSARLRPARAIA